METNNFWAKLKLGIKETVLRSPVEVVVCLGFSVLALFIYQSGSYFNAMLHFPLVLAAVMVCNNVCSRNRLMYYIAGIVTAVVLSWLAWAYRADTGYAVGLVIASLAVVLTQSRDDDEATSASIFSTLACTAVSAVVGSIVLLVMCIVMLVAYARDGADDGVGFLLLWLPWSFTLVAPITFLALYNRRRDKPLAMGDSNLFKILAQYVITLGIILYTVVIYAYMLRDIFAWEFPLDKVSSLVAGYYAVAALGYGARKWAPMEVCVKFYQWLPWVVVPIAAFYWAVAGSCIGDHSLTQARVYVLVVGIVIMLLTVLMIMRHSNTLKIVGWTLVVGLAVITYIPGIDAQSLSNVAQTHRMEHYMRLLDVVDEAGHFKPYDKEKVKGKDREIKQLQDSYEYLKHHLGGDVVDAKYRPVNDFYRDILSYGEEEENPAFNFSPDIEIKVIGD